MTLKEIKKSIQEVSKRLVQTELSNCQNNSMQSWGFVGAFILFKSCYPEGIVGAKRTNLSMELSNFLFLFWLKWKRLFLHKA